MVSGSEVTATYYYDAFGVHREATGDGENPFRYAGYRYEESTGLYYLNARFYDPEIARFLQEDTYRGQLDDPLSLNLYTYCYNNPLIYSDPSGHVVTDWDRANLSSHELWLLEQYSNLWDEYNAAGNLSGKALTAESAAKLRAPYLQANETQLPTGHVVSNSAGNGYSSIPSVASGGTAGNGSGGKSTAPIVTAPDAKGLVVAPENYIQSDHFAPPYNQHELEAWVKQYNELPPLVMAEYIAEKLGLPFTRVRSLYAGNNIPINEVKIGGKTYYLVVSNGVHLIDPRELVYEFVDLDKVTHLPGDQFKTQDHAAMAAALIITPPSVSKTKQYPYGLEYAANLYEELKDGKTWYTFGNVTKGTVFSVKMPAADPGRKFVGAIHTHGAYRYAHDPVVDRFSGWSESVNPNTNAVRVSGDGAFARVLLRVCRSPFGRVMVDG